MRSFRRNILTRLTAVAAMAALVSTACQAGPPTGGPAESPVSGGRIIEGSFADIKIMTPGLTNDVPSSTVSNRIYDGLYEANAKTGELGPLLGKWTISSDGKTYNWEIDANAKWSDGQPVVALDWVTTAKSIARSKLTVRKSSFVDVVGFKEYSEGTATSLSGVTVDGDKKFSVTFTRAFCPALVNVFGHQPIPAHVFAKYTVDSDPTKNYDAAPENLAPTVASGPFKFKEWRQGDQVILEKNAAYWRGTPFVDEYIYKVVADSTVLAAQLKTGEVNYGTVQPSDFDDLNAQSQLKIYEYQALGYVYIGWNMKSQSSPGLAEKNVRQALAYGLDMSAVVQAILFGHGTKMVAHHPPVSWASPGAGLNQYEYNKTKAEELLTQAGYAKGADGFYAKGGRTLEFSIVTNQGNRTRETFLQVAEEQYKQIGVKVNPKLESFETMVDKLTKGDQSIEAWIIGWSLGIEPDPYGIWHSSNIPNPAANKTGFNFGAFDSRQADAAMEAGRGPDCTQAARKAQYETFNKVLNEEQPYNFGFSQNTIVVTSANMQGYEPGSFNQYPDMHKWWFKQ